MEITVNEDLSIPVFKPFSITLTFKNQNDVIAWAEGLADIIQYKDISRIGVLTYDKPQNIITQIVRSRGSK